MYAMVYGQISDRFAFETHRPGVGEERPGGQIDKRRFAGPIWADNGGEPASGDRQGHTVDGREVPEAFGDALNR